jgi:trehalose synthase
MDKGMIAEYMRRALENPDETKALGQAAQEHVRENFLLPDHVKKYIQLLQHYTGVNLETPKFRINELTYSELLHSFRFQNPALLRPMGGNSGEKS